MPTPSTRAPLHFDRSHEASASIAGHSQVVELIPLSKEICKSGLRRYGFHGLSYESIASVLPTVAPAIAKARVIVAHPGSGASPCTLTEFRHG